MKAGRREFMTAVAIALALPNVAHAASASVEVWKAPSCGCCKDWIRHLESNGFKVTVHDSGNTAARARLGIPIRLGSCHTALVEGYAIEGHVPMRHVARLLHDKPRDIRGIAVPGMPRGSPGMEMPDGSADAFEVMAFGSDGKVSEFRA